MKTGEGEPEKHAGAENLKCITNQDDVAPIEAVGHVAAGQYKEEAGQEQRETGVPKIERAVRDLVDLPGNRDGLSFCAHDDQCAGRLIQSEVSIGECRCSGTLGAITHIPCKGIPRRSPGAACKQAFVKIEAWAILLNAQMWSLARDLQDFPRR